MSLLKKMIQPCKNITIKKNKNNKGIMVDVEDQGTDY